MTRTVEPSMLYLTFDGTAGLVATGFAGFRESISEHPRLLHATTQ